ncbi:MAG: hydrogenase maturation protease [Proteobacteria bacterium]|nr:hydrogenase maturation protease [Pseudomonadota bacterium]
MGKAERILVLGLGNEVLTDDAIGPKLVRWLEEQCPDQRVDYEVAATGGLNILEMAEGYQRALFVDAIKTKGGVPGDVYWLTDESFDNALHLTSVHDISFLQAFELGRALNLEVPTEVKVVAVEIVEDLVFSNEFSPPVAARWDEIKETVTNWYRDFLAEEGQ